MISENELLSAARQTSERVVDVRRTIHRFPELGNHLPRTRATVLDALGGLDLDVHLSAMTSGIVAVLKGGGGPGPTVLLRGDMDALPMPEDTGLSFASQVPGVMHACGHDTHTAMLVGAAHLLSRRQQSLQGNVAFMFQPGEEGPGGAEPMLDEGICEAGGRPTAAFGLHVYPNKKAHQVFCKPGTMMASVDTLHLRLIGKGGHGSMPYDANDPVPVACAIVQAFQTVVTRRFNPFDPVVVTVGHISAGTTSNVIPEDAVMSVTVRAFNPGPRAFVLELLETVARGIASAHGMQLECAVGDDGYPPTVNTVEGAAAVARAARELNGDEGYCELDQPIAGAEDFSYVIERYGGAFAFLGARPENVCHADAAPCHSNRMMIDESAMTTGVAMHAALAINFLREART
jgi:amidohydrolase